MRNKYALDAFLDYLDEQFPVDNILNVGDSVNIGPHPQEVVSKIMEDSRFMSILGGTMMKPCGKLLPKSGLKMKFYIHYGQENKSEQIYLKNLVNSQNSSQSKSIIKLCF